jgi:hypothetical protein
MWLRGDLYGHLPELLNLFPLVRLRTSPYPRRYGVTITGLLVTVFPASQDVCAIANRLWAQFVLPPENFLEIAEFFGVCWYCMYVCGVCVG